MQTVQASEAKTHFLRILDQVERGESVTVTRHGKTIARIVPVTPSDEERRERFERAMQGIRELRQKVGKLSIEEILSARDEGRA